MPLVMPEAQREEWGPRCVDEFEKFWGNMLFSHEKEALKTIWSKIQTSSSEEEATLYHEAVGVLHFVWCRDMEKKGYTKCTLRSPDFDEMGTAPYGISEAKREEEIIQGQSRVHLCKNAQDAEGAINE